MNNSAVEFELSAVPDLRELAALFERIAKRGRRIKMPMDSYFEPPVTEGVDEAPSGVQEQRVTGHLLLFGGES